MKLKRIKAVKVFFKTKEKSTPKYSIDDTQVKLVNFWKSLSRPVLEDELLGKWFIAIYKDPKLRVSWVSLMEKQFNCS